MRKYVTEPEIREVIREATPKELQQVRDFLGAMKKSTGIKCYICKILQIDTHAEMVTAGATFDGLGLPPEKILQILPQLLLADRIPRWKVLSTKKIDLPFRKQSG